jgi:hypothetical protein
MIAAQARHSAFAAFDAPWDRKPAHGTSYTLLRPLIGLFDRLGALPTRETRHG